MASLPEGWEFDYDGHRWFYRYKPSGVVQYQFPKPGDEFPEFIDAFSPPPALAPEEKLESQHQVKRRSTAGEQASRTRGSGKNVASGATLFESDEGGSGGSWFQPDSFMYLGPGSYNDISPEQDDEYGPGDTTRSRSGQSVPATQADRLNISPMGSSQGTPHVPNSQPLTLANTPVSVHRALSRSSTTGSMMTPPTVGVEVGAYFAEQYGAQVTTSTVEVQMLDSRPMQPTFNPVGHMAELYSELTTQCSAESHPPPVELPSGNMIGGPTSFGNGTFDVAPVELPSLVSPVERRGGGAKSEQKVLMANGAQGAQYSHEQQQGQPTTQHIPGGPAHPQVGSNRSTLPSTAGSNTGDSSAQAGKYQAFVPGKEDASRNEIHRTSVSGASDGHSIARNQETELGLSGNRHSVTGTSHSEINQTDVPSVLQPYQALDKPGRLALASHEQPGSSHPLMPGSGARHRSESESTANEPNQTVRADESRLRDHPSALKPAALRSSAQPLTALSTTSQPSRPFSAYRPAHIVEPRGEQSQSSPSQHTQAMPSHVQSFPKVDHGIEPGPDAEPQFRLARTNTLPIDLPSLPFMGVSRPIAPRPNSTALVMQHQQPAAAAVEPTIDDHKAKVPEQMDAKIHGTLDHVRQNVILENTGFKPESPDAPPPLSLGRKTPRPDSESSALRTESSRPSPPKDTLQHPGTEVQPLDVPVMSANFAARRIAKSKPTSLPDQQTGTMNQPQGSHSEHGRPEGRQNEPHHQNQPSHGDASRVEQSPTPQPSTPRPVQARPWSPDPVAQQLGTIDEVSITAVSASPSPNTTASEAEVPSQYPTLGQNQLAPPRPPKISTADETPTASLASGTTNVEHPGSSRPSNSSHADAERSPSISNQPVTARSQPGTILGDNQQPNGMHRRPSYPTSLHQSASDMSQISSVSGDTLSETSPSPMTLPGSPQPNASSSQHFPSFRETAAGSNDWQAAQFPPETTRPQSIHSVQSTHSAYGQTTPPGSANLHRPSFSGASFSSGFGPSGGRPTLPPGSTVAQPNPPSPVVNRPPSASGTIGMSGAQGTGYVQQQTNQRLHSISEPTGGTGQVVAPYQQPQQQLFMQQNPGQRPPSQGSTNTLSSMHSTTSGSNRAPQQYTIQQGGLQGSIHTHPPSLQGSVSSLQQGQSHPQRPEATYGHTLSHEAWVSQQQHPERLGVPIPVAPGLPQQQNTHQASGLVQQTMQVPGQPQHLPLGPPPPGAILVDPNKPLPPGYVLVGGPLPPAGTQLPQPGFPGMPTQSGPSAVPKPGGQAAGPLRPHGAQMSPTSVPSQSAPLQVSQQGQPPLVHGQGPPQTTHLFGLQGQVMSTPAQLLQQGMVFQGKTQGHMFPAGHSQGSQHPGLLHGPMQPQDTPSQQGPTTQQNTGQVVQPNPPPVGLHGQPSQAPNVQHTAPASMQGQQLFHGTFQSPQPLPHQVPGAPLLHQAQQPMQHSNSMPGPGQQHIQLQAQQPHSIYQQQQGHQPGKSDLPHTSPMPAVGQPAPSQHSAQQLGQGQQPPAVQQQHPQHDQHAGQWPAQISHASQPTLGQIQQQQLQQDVPPLKVDPLTPQSQQSGHAASIPVQSVNHGTPPQQGQVPGNSISQPPKRRPQPKPPGMGGTLNNPIQSQTLQQQQNQSLPLQHTQSRPLALHQPPLTQQPSQGPQTINGPQQINQAIYQSQQQSAPLFLQTNGPVVQQHPQYAGQTPTSASADTPTNSKNGWLNKTTTFFKKDAVKKIGFAVGGAVVAESLGVSGATGANIGSRIFDTTRPNTTQPQTQKPPQQQAQLQGNQMPQKHQQPSRPHLNHVQTAPAQVQSQGQPHGQVQLQGQVHVQGQVQIGLGQPQLQPQSHVPPGQQMRPSQQQLPSGQQQQHPPVPIVQQAAVGPQGPGSSAPQSQGTQQVDVGIQILEAVVNRPQGAPARPPPRQGVNSKERPQHQQHQHQHQHQLSDDHTIVSTATGESTSEYTYAPPPLNVEYHSEVNVNVDTSTNVNTANVGAIQGQSFGGETIVVNETTYTENNYVEGNTSYVQETTYNDDTTIVQDTTYDQNVTYNQDVTYNEGTTYVEEVTYDQDTSYEENNQYVEDTSYVQEQAYVGAEISYDGSGWGGDFDEGY